MDKPIPRLRVCVEGAVIVGSILLAFGIDAWWDGKQARIEEGVYLTRLHDELVRGLPVMRLIFRMARASAAVDSLLTLQESGSRRETGGIASLVLDAVQYEFNSADILLDQTYQEMLATGSLSLIENQAVREAIAGYFHRVYRFSGALEVASAEGHRASANRVRGEIGRIEFRSGRAGLLEPEVEMSADATPQPTTHLTAQPCMQEGLDLAPPKHTQECDAEQSGQ